MTYRTDHFADGPEDFPRNTLCLRHVGYTTTQISFLCVNRQARRIFFARSPGGAVAEVISLDRGGQQ